MKSPVLLREGLSSSGAGAQLHKSLGSLCLGVLVMDRQFTAARSNEEDDGDMARDPSSWCFRGRFPADNTTSSLSDWQSIFSSKSRIQSSESLAMTDGSSPFMQSSPPRATVICAASSSMDSGVGEEYVRRAEVNPVTYETFKAIAQKQPEACGSATELSASTLPSAVAEQSSDVSVSSPLNSRVQMAARSSDEVDNVSDAESIFYAVRQYDDSSHQVLASPGMHPASLHRASQPHEELVLSRVKLMCSFGGEIMPRPSDGKLRYVGGETRIITVKRDIRYVGFMLKMTEFYGMALTLKYQLPGEDLDALVSVFSDEDMQNMMEEYDKIEASDGSLWLRLFLFCVDHDVYTLGSIDQDCCNSPEKSYLDALNSVPEKGYRKHFENDIAREQQETDECARSVAQGGQTSRDALGHGQPPDAWTNFALQTFSRAPSPPSSPPLSSRQAEAKQLAVADASLQFFQDRLNRVSVRRHEASRRETSHQELEQSGSGCTSSTPQLEYQYQRESHRAPDSPRRTLFDIISHRAEHWRTGEAPGERTDFQLDPTWMSEHGTLNDPIDSLSEVQPSKVTLPLADLQQHVHFIQQQQQQQQILQQQQSPRQPPLDSWSTEFQNADPMQHSQPHTRTFLKFVPYPESHQSTTVKDRVPRQAEQPSFHMEDTLGANFFPSSSSHTLGTQRSYQIVSPSLSPRLAVHDPQGKLAVAQQHAQVQRILNGPTGDYYHGRMVQLPGDQSSRRYRVSTSSSHYRDNLMQSDEHSVWLLQQQQYQHNLGGSDIELQPWMESSLQHFYERDSASQTYFSAALSKQHLVQSGGLSSFLESLMPLNEKQEACVKGYEMIQEKENQAFPSQHLPFTSHVSRLDCHEQRSHTTEQASVHSGYSEVQEQPGEWVAHQRNQEENEARMCPAGRGLRRPASRNEELGKEFESGRCRESMGLSSSHHKEDFLSFVSFALGDREVPSHQGREWPESCIPLPATFDSSLLLSSKVVATTNNALVSEGLQVSLPVTGRPSEIDQLSRLEMSKSASTRFESKHVTEVEPSVLPQEVGVIYAKQQSGVLRVVGDRTSEKDLDIWRGPSTAGLWNAVQYGLEGSSAEMSMYPGNLHHEHYSSGPDSFVKGMVGKGKRPAGEESNRLKSITQLTVASTRPSCDNGIHDERTPIEDLRIYISSNDGVGGGSCTSMPTSPAAPVSSPLSYHDTSVASHGWQDVAAATLNVGASGGLVNLSNLPIYDQSPSSSTNTTASRDFSLEPTEAEDSNCKEISAARMSVTGRLAEDMICSVLDSFSKEPLSKGNICVHASIHEKSADGNMLEETKGDLEKISGNVAETKNAAPSSESPAIVAGSCTQAAKDPSRGSGDREKVKEGILEEPSHSKERNHETVQICRENVAAAGNVKNEVKNLNGLSGSEAELEAYSHGLQTIKNADLEEMRELGSGTFGTVYHGKWRGSDVAIKRIKASCFAGSPSDQERLISDFWREAWTLGQLHHPNVVAFYGVVSDGPGGTLATVTEYMVNGSLKQVLQKKDRTIDRRKRLLIAMDAAFGMEYLHGKNIVHFDLKCENLLVNMRDPHRPICKVGDFGLSKVKRQTLVSGGVRGTLPWMAPELLNGKCSMVTEKVDVFSFGIVMWELLTGEEPYANIHSGAIIGGIVNNTLRPPIPSWCDPAWRSLMEKCWSGDPIERPPFSEVASDLRAIAASLNLK